MPENNPDGFKYFPKHDDLANGEASKGVTIGYAIKHPYMFITNSSEYIAPKTGTEYNPTTGEGYDPTTGDGFNFRNHWHIQYVIKNVGYLNEGTHIMFNAWNAGATRAGYTFVSSATIVKKEAWNAYQVYIYVIDRNKRENPASTDNLRNYLTPSSNSYGLAVRPMHVPKN